MGGPQRWVTTKMGDHKVTTKMGDHKDVLNFLSPRIFSEKYGLTTKMSDHKDEWPQRWVDHKDGLTTENEWNFLSAKIFSVNYGSITKMGTTKMGDHKDGLTTKMGNHKDGATTEMGWPQRWLTTEMSLIFPDRGVDWGAIWGVEPQKKLVEGSGVDTKMVWPGRWVDQKDHLCGSKCDPESYLPGLKKMTLTICKTSTPSHKFWTVPKVFSYLMSSVRTPRPYSSKLLTSFIEADGMWLYTKGCTKKGKLFEVSWPRHLYYLIKCP